MSSPERKLDLKIINALVQDATLVIVGEVVKQPAIDSAHVTRTALGGNSHFTVQVHRLLIGSIPTNKPITVSAVRDEVNFRYPMRESLIFFLKKGTYVPGKSYDPLVTPGEWRAVSDYFGVIPYQMTLERAIKPPKPEVRTLPDSSGQKGP